MAGMEIATIAVATKALVNLIIGTSGRLGRDLLATDVTLRSRQSEFF
jgi:hypothetical protein